MMPNTAIATRGKENTTDKRRLKDETHFIVKIPPTVGYTFLGTEIMLIQMKFATIPRISSLYKPAPHVFILLEHINVEFMQKVFTILLTIH